MLIYRFIKSLIHKTYPVLTISLVAFVSVPAASRSASAPSPVPLPSTATYPALPETTSGASLLPASLTTVLLAASSLSSPSIISLTIPVTTSKHALTSFPSCKLVSNSSLSHSLSFLFSQYFTILLLCFIVTGVCQHRHHHLH